MMILYVGNKLSKHGFSVTSVETLGPLLQGLGYDVGLVSDKRHEVLRLVDVLWHILIYSRQLKLVIIDAYSTRNFYVLLLASVLCRILRIKYVPILRGGNLVRRLKKTPRLCRMVFQNSYANVAPSGYLNAMFAEFSYESVLIPNNIQIHNYDFHPRTDVVPKILWVRAYHKIYNPQLAIHAVQELYKSNKQVRLCMVGPDKDGSLQLCKELVVKYGLEDVVELKGKLSKAEWVELSRNYDLFLNTTTQDNMPISVMESMALGLPVVSTDVGGLPYLLEDKVDSLMFVNGDLQQLVHCINLLCSNSELVQQLSRNGRQKVLRYDWSVVSAQWKHLIDGCIN